MHLGLIGGIGPAATVTYYTRLVAAFRKKERPLELTIVQCDLDTLLRFAAENRRDDMAQVYAELLKRLAAAGADVATIPSLGGHFCFEETRRLSPIPLVSAIEPIDREVRAQGLASVGLLGTRQVTSSALYGGLDATDVLAPDDVDQAHDAYIKMATAGVCSAALRAQVFADGQAMIDRGAEAVILAGTDLGLAFDGFDPGYPTIDAAQIHIDHLVALATAAP